MGDGGRKNLGSITKGDLSVTTTTNLNLKKPEQSDGINIADINGNMDTLDQQIKGLKDKFDPEGRAKDADRLGGMLPSDLALRDHNHSGVYAPATHSHTPAEAGATPAAHGQDGTIHVTAADKTNWNGKAAGDHSHNLLTYTATHSKSGTVHTLTGLPAVSGIYIAQFKAVANFDAGNTFAGGYTAKPMGEETTLPDKAFITGDLVSVVVDVSGKKLGFKLGGGGINVKCYVQTTEPPSPKQGEFWVLDSGYMLNKLEFSTVRPTNFAENTLFVETSISVNTGKIVSSNDLNVTSYIKYVQPYVTGNYKTVSVKYYTGNSWMDVGVKSNRLYFTHYGMVFELDQLTLAKTNTRSVHGTMLYGIGGIVGKLWSTVPPGDARIYELDPQTLSILHTAFSGYYGIGGTSTHLWACNGDFSLYKLDPATLAVISTVSTGLSGTSNYASGIGGTSNTLWFNTASAKTMYKVDAMTGAKLTSAISTGSYGLSEIGGTTNKLFGSTGVYWSEDGDSGYTPYVTEYDPNTGAFLRGVFIKTGYADLGSGSYAIGGTK